MSNENKHTGKDAASAASDVLRDGRTADDSKTAGGSALSQADKSTDKSTSENAAEKASEVLQDDDTSDKSKTGAGSALSQKEKDKN
jgi:hypothetical protein